MTENEIARRMLRRTTRGMPATSPTAKAVLEWARANGTALFGLTAGQATKLTWTALARKLADEALPAEQPASVLTLAADFARLLRLDPIDAAVVQVLFAIERLRLPADLATLTNSLNFPLAAVVGEAAGAPPQDAERVVRRNPLVRHGLISFRNEGRGTHGIEVRWTLTRLIDRLPDDAAEIIEVMIGPKQTARLSLAAFAHVEDADFLLRLLQGAARERAAGINILVHGPPGTGKTEFVRALADAAGLALHGVGEADDGEEPDRWDRIGALVMGQRLLDESGAVLLFDEMEDLIGDAQFTRGDWMKGREGSKVFINRLLETNAVPVIWTTNAIGNVDPAMLRRMSHVVRMDLPSRDTAARMLAHVAAEEQVTPAPAFEQLLERAPETAAVLRVAARGARLAGEPDGGVRSARALVRALRGRELPLAGPGAIDLDLCVTDTPIAPLFERLRNSDTTDVSLLLTGPPGTGKTALAHHLARLLDRPLIVKRCSDLLSKWVGETEQQIAEAFGEARHKGGILLFDEVDSLLSDRSRARQTWEVSQVNELLTWLDGHPLPVVAATNHDERLDPATARRFVVKLALRELDAERAACAFERFFALPAPASLAAVRRLTPGDFALVARQLRHRPARDAREIVARLQAEAACKPGASRPIGF